MNDYIILVCDGAGWHKSDGLIVPENIEILHIPPYTPEMNPIEQVWAWLRRHGFRNEAFATLEKVMNRLCDTINSLTETTVKSIALRDWMYA
ncbi:hypothetical protein FACS189490_08930 [Clostridia bacterium]|nr:hypothetical protein FACS189490_08930 [Clostridia bacterium]